MRSRFVIFGCALLAVAGLPTAPAASAVSSGSLTWHAPQLHDPERGGLASISCVSATFCRAGDENGRVLRWDGVRWAAGAVLSAEGGNVAGMSCSSTTFCAAIVNSHEGAYQPVTFDGSTWNRTAAFVEGIGAEGMSCTSSTFCILTNNDGSFQRWNGASWSAPRKIDTVEFFAGLHVSCATATLCRAADASGRIMTYDGVGWTAPVIRDPGHQLTGISCPTTTSCIAIDGSGRFLRRLPNGSWSAPVAIDAAANELAALDCTSASFCVASDLTGHGLAYHGSSWTTPRLLSAAGTFGSVSCGGALFCAAVSGQGEIDYRVNGSWGPAVSIDPALGGPSSVSCASRSLCVAVDSSGGATAFTGSDWTTPHRVTTRPFGFTGVSCPTSTFCLAVTQDGYSQTRVHGSWSKPVKIVPSDSGLAAVSCASATFCVAGAFDGTVANWNGSHWTTHALTEDGINAVSCVTGLCVATTTTGRVATYRGTWSTPQYIGTYRIVTVSCSSTGFCLGMGEHGRAYRFDGSTWTPASSPSRTLPRLSVSCASHTFCVAVGSHTEATYDGTQWHAHTLGDNLDDPQFFLVSVSCRTTICAAVDSSGYGFVAN